MDFKGLEVVTGTVMGRLEKLAGFEEELFVVSLSLR